MSDDNFLCFPSYHAKVEHRPDTMKVRSENSPTCALLNKCHTREYNVKTLYLQCLLEIRITINGDRLYFFLSEDIILKVPVISSECLMVVKYYSQS